MSIHLSYKRMQHFFDVPSIFPISIAKLLKSFLFTIINCHIVILLLCRLQNDEQKIVFLRLGMVSHHLLLLALLFYAYYYQGPQMQAVLVMNIFPCHLYDMCLGPLSEIYIPKHLLLLMLNKFLLPILIARKMPLCFFRQICRILQLGLLSNISNPT